MTIDALDRRDLPSTRSAPLTAREVLGQDRWTRVRRVLDHEPFRRLSHEPEVTVRNEMLCQSVHIDRFEGEARPILGGSNSQYFMHSLDSAKREIETLLGLGVKAVYLQLLPDEAGKTYYGRIDIFARMVRDLRETFGRDLTVAVDPQGICMGNDLRWGARDAAGDIDIELTLDLLAEAAFRLAQAGMDAFTVIGRANYEAAVARKAIDLHDPAIELWSFSTNSETPNAYFDVTRYDLAKAQTGQKIIVGNSVEMMIRALMDIVEGVDVMLQKPVENIYVLSAVRELLDGRLALSDLLGHERVEKLAADNPALFEGDVFSTEEAKARLAGAGIGSYEVSGTYSIFKMIEDTYGEPLALAMLDELYRNALAAGGHRMKRLVGRNMLWFAETRKRLGL